MNFGMIVRHALNKSELPFDAEHLEIAKAECNDIIRELWGAVKAPFRISTGTLALVAGTNEYYLPKNFDSFVKYTLQSDTVRYRYKSPEEYHRRILVGQDVSGEAYVFTLGEMTGVDAQLLAASRIRFISSNAGKSTDTVNVWAGSSKVTSASDIFDLNDVGQYLKITGDSKSYRISAFVNSKEIELSEKYRGATAAGAAYQIGDVGIHAQVMGYVGGQLTSEDVILNGATEVLTSKTFSTVVSISKAEYTNGYITVTNAANTRTLGVLAPTENQVERQTVLIWPEPGSSESLTFRYFMKHPDLWLDSDRPLLPEKYHSLIRLKLEKVMTQWANKDFAEESNTRMQRLENQYYDDAEDVSLEDTIPQRDGRSRYGDQFLYDKDEDFY